MTTLDTLFRAPIDPLPHPWLREWRRRLQRPESRAELELSRAETWLGLPRAELTIRYTENGSPPAEEVIPWDDTLNEGLVRLHVRAVTTDQEAFRFSLGLRAAFRGAANEHGDGYFNHALRVFLEESDLAACPEIAGALMDLPPRHPTAATNAGPVREMIADAISGRAHELTGQLGYPEPDAKRILVAALARYLDDRFSITCRRRMAGP